MQPIPDIPTILVHTTRLIIVIMDTVVADLAHILVIRIKGTQELIPFEIVHIYGKTDNVRWQSNP